MLGKLDQIILDVYGVDTAELVAEYDKIVPDSVLDEYGNIINALAAAIAAALHGKMPEVMFGASRLLFAAGYRAGQNDIRLDIFRDALTGEENE